MQIGTVFYNSFNRHCPLYIFCKLNVNISSKAQHTYMQEINNTYIMAISMLTELSIVFCNLMYFPIYSDSI